MPAARSIRPPRSSRADGTATRAQILEAAGRLYAEKGYARTTSKEICAAAGANQAAVNYHFGSKAGLYDAVLVESHRQIVSLDELQLAAGRADLDPLARLASALVGVVTRASEASAPWGVRVIAREMMAPTSHARTLVERAVVPKAGVLLRLVATALELPPTHPAVQRSLAFVIGPVMALSIAPRELRRVVLPALERDAEALREDLVAYMSAGLQAVRRRHAKARPTAGRASDRPPATPTRVVSRRRPASG